MSFTAECAARMALPSLSSDLSGDAGTFKIILDTGCSFAVSPSLDDFIEMSQVGNLGTIITASTSIPIEGFGLAAWLVVATDGTTQRMQVPCHYVPSCLHRLLSPQDYDLYHSLSTKKDQFGGHSASMWMAIDKSNAVMCHYDSQTRLPFITARNVTKPPCSCTATHICSACPNGQLFSSLLAPGNHNLTGAQKSLLRDHFRLGHVNFQQLQSLYTTSGAKCFGSACPEPCLPLPHPQAASCQAPMCTACQLAKARRQNVTVKRTTAPKELLLSEDIVHPGQVISVDQYESSVLGRIPSTRGRDTSLSSTSSLGGTIFVDHSSGFVFLHHQSSLSSNETLDAKRSFEQEAARCGVRILRYHTDNGVFGSKLVSKDIYSSGQELTFSGVGAHHQNGTAERYIQTVVSKARAMMLHCALHWPSSFDANLWPLALSYSCWLHNHTPSRRGDGQSPMELFCGVKMSCQHLCRARVWGCPVYVLDPRLQDGKKIPKWHAKARQGQFLGFSPLHSTSVGLIRNLRTERISPQFHVVYDQDFETVLSEVDALSPNLWADLYTTSRELVESEIDDTVTVHADWIPDEEMQQQPMPSVEPPLHADLRPSQALPIPGPMFNSTLSPIQPRNQGEYQVDEQGEDDDDQQGEFNLTQQGENADKDESIVDQVAEPRVSMRRIRHPNPRYFGEDWDNSTSEALFVQQMTWEAQDKSPWSLYFAFLIDNATDPRTSEVLYQHPGMFAVQANAEDNPRLQDIMKLRDTDERDKWMSAMDLELDELQDKQTFEVVDVSTVPNNEQVVPCTWVYKRKRTPDGTISKFKARLCVRGDQQHFDDSEEFYAPVVEWSTIRLLFNLSIAYNLPTTQIDFKNAFVQSSLPTPIFVSMPPGGYSQQYPGKVLKVSKSLYGDRRAPRLWYLHLRKAMESRGFTVSTLDPCLFLRSDCVFVAYVDDGIFISHNAHVAEDVITSLQQDNFDLTKEGDLAAYLGVQIAQMPDGSFHLSQPALINRIIEALALTDANGCKTPAEAALGRELDSAPATRAFNYRSVIGMLLYLGNNTRPDCSFAIH
jgi:hypothetical protein